jgi:hypothetical protein
VLSGAQGKKEGKFYRHVEAVPPHHRGLQELQHGRGAVATCGGADGQWGMAVRPLASARRPRGTGLGLHASVTASSAQCHRRGPRTAGFPAPRRAHASWVQRGRRGGARTTSCAGALTFKTVSFSHFQTKFSPKI